MPDRLLGVLRHQCLELVLRALVVEKGLPGVAEKGGELGPRVRRAHVDDADGLDARPWRLCHDEVRDFAPRQLSSGIESETLWRMRHSAQIRAARALLGWSQTQLARRAGLGSTLQRIERHEGIEKGKFSTVIKIQKALEQAGIHFIEDDTGEIGVRLKIRTR